MKKNSRRSTTGSEKENRSCGEVVLGGAELHVKFTRQYGDPGPFVAFSPPLNAGGLPEGIEDINGRLAGLCQEKILDMKDPARLRLLALAERDSGNDRMLYRLVVKAWTEEDGSHGTRVVDFVDTEFAQLDAGVTGRARACREEIERVLAGGTPEFSGTVSPESTGDSQELQVDPVDDRGVGIPAGAGMDELAPLEDGNWESARLEVVGRTTNYPGADGRSAEEARRGMLAGEEFMILELQVIGSTGGNGREDWTTFEYIAAISEKAVESPWMQEKILSLSKICGETVMAIDPITNRCLSMTLEGEGVREKCLYRLSVWASLRDDGSPCYSIRDAIDPGFESQDSTSGVRAIEARRLAGIVIEGMQQ